MSVPTNHPVFSRRTALQAGSLGLLSLGTNHLSALQAANASANSDRAVIFVFLSGGLGQQDSFDMKPNAPDNVRGEFLPASTATPGLQICEHLPELAKRSRMWSLVRSLTHPYNEHSQGHMVMLSGRTKLPPTFNASKPMPEDWPSIPAIVGDIVGSRGNLPPAVILPEELIHRTGRVIPGQLAGVMGARRNPWVINASPFNGTTYGAYPTYEFHHARGFENKPNLKFQAPNLSLPEGLGQPRLAKRLDLLGTIEKQRQELESAAVAEDFDRHRQNAVSLLTSQKVRRVFDVVNADDKTLDRYGRNSFGWSTLMAKRLVEAGVNLVQVNLGNNEAWDTHGNAFPNLKNYLFPPTDQCISALLDDLEASGRLDSTLIVMAGEFGRTPKLSHLAQHYKLSGRDHWGAVQTVFLAGGGAQGGKVIGSSDSTGGYPADNPQTPESLAATIYDFLGIPATAAWKDDLNRPHHIYHGVPIAGLV